MRTDIVATRPTPCRGLLIFDALLLLAHRVNPHLAADPSASLRSPSESNRRLPPLLGWRGANSGHERPVETLSIRSTISVGVPGDFDRSGLPEAGQDHLRRRRSAGQRRLDRPHFRAGIERLTR